MIDAMNTEYVDNDFYFLDARQLAVDADCAGDTTTFGDTTICPGLYDKDFEDYLTDSPTEAPAQ